MNATELSRSLADRAADVANYLLPNGKKAGQEWKVADLSGGAGNSLSVRTGGAKAGLWSDFSTGVGGDLLDLWAACRGLGVAEAMAEAKAYLGIRDTAPRREEKTFKRPAKPKGQTARAGGMVWLQVRLLTPETIAIFKVIEFERDGKTYVGLPYLRDGEFINLKTRNVADKKDMRQEAGAEPCLFGWQTIDPRARQVAICEGEIDAMTLYQVGIPALSVNAGAGNFQWLENDYDRLDRFSDILIFFDHDEAGDKGAAELIRRLGTERCRRVKLPAKDANEYLMGGATAEDFARAVKAAKHQDPDELKSSAEFFDQVRALFYPAAGAQEGYSLFLDQSMKWFTFRNGELTVWTGYNGHGKSLLLSQVLLGLMKQGCHVTIFSGEMSPPRQLKRMAKQATGVDKPTLAYLTVVQEWLRDRLWLFDMVGSAKIDRLLQVFSYARRRYGVEHFVIDSLMMTDVPEDGPGSMTAQKQAVQKLCDFAKKMDCHVHLVAHPRKGRDESAGPGKQDVAGSGKITDGADNVFTVWSAQKDESAPPTPDEADGRLELHKQRNGDIQRFTQHVFFDKDSMQYRTTSRHHLLRFVPISEEMEEVPL